VDSETDRAHVRLAELVGSLSFGVDLGFGQPMEHALRQCLIALPIAERLGLDEAAIGASSRAAAGLYAAQHDLPADEEAATPAPV
jgi:hypothetical protein